MKLAVTGASGFLGRHFVAAATRAGHEVRALVRPGVELPKGVKAFPGTLEDSVSDDFLQGAEVLVHLAALGVQSRDRDWSRAAEVNVLGSLNLVRAATRAGVGRLVLAGTCLEYQGFGLLPELPDTSGALCDERASTESSEAYGATKAAGGLLMRAAAREAGVEHWYLRFASMYGASDDAAKLIPGALLAAREGRPYETSPGAQEREWLHVDDAVRALFAACERSPSASDAIVNVGTGEGVSLLELVREIFTLSGAELSLIRAGSRPYRRGEVHRLVMDVSRARALLGFSAQVTLQEGLGRLVREMR